MSVTTDELDGGTIDLHRIADRLGELVAIGVELPDRLDRLGELAEHLVEAVDVHNAHLEHLVEAVYDVSEAIRQSKLELQDERIADYVHAPS